MLTAISIVGQPGVGGASRPGASLGEQIVMAGD